MIDDRIILNLMEQLLLAHSIDQQTLTVDVTILAKLLVEITSKPTVIVNDLPDVLAKIKDQNKLEH